MPASLSALQPWFYPWARWLMMVCNHNGLRPVVTSTYRTRQEQAALWADYQAGRTQYSVAPPGSSQHERGLAFDVDLPETRWLLPALGRVWRDVGGVWGGEADPVHFAAPQ